jgi:hypothetical protein
MKQAKTGTRLHLESSVDHGQANGKPRHLVSTGSLEVGRPSLKNQSGLTTGTLKSLLKYDPITGLFVRTKSIRGQKIDSRVGTLIACGYTMISVNCINVLAHRLAFFYMTGTWPKHDIDHINGNRNDNRWSNLREATRSQNLMNARLRSDNKSGFKGVKYHAASKLWTCGLHHNGKYLSLGYYKTSQEANGVVMRRRLELHGEFANHGT